MRVLLLLALVSPAWAEPLRPVVTEIVSADAVRARSFTGVIVAEQQAVLAFQTAGRVAEMDLAPGDKVAKGQVLAVLDRVSLADDVTAAEAALVSARASAEAAEAGFARAEALATKGVTAAAALDQARQARDSAAAGVAAAEAELARARDAAGFGSLSAPEEGVVLATEVKPGAVVAAGTPVLTLALGTGREAILDLPADYLALLTPGRAFTLRSRVAGAAPIRGTLRLVEPVSDTATRSRRIRVSLSDPPDLWRIGALVRAELDESAAPVITLPFGAVLDGKVWVVAEGRKAHLVPVALGARLGDRVVVTEGLAPGQEVVVRGVHSLAEGQDLGARE